MSEVTYRRNRRHRGASRHSVNYWCIKTDLSSDGEIFVIADHLDVTSAGALIASRSSANQTCSLILAPGTWTAVYAASTHDGSPIAIEHWEGEIEP
jgi:hypothetical protein